MCKNVFPLAVSKNNVESYRTIWNLLDKTFQKSKFSQIPLSLFLYTCVFIYKLDMLDFEIYLYNTQFYNIPVLLLISRFQNI